jgi:pimeloyl-ACP methyl ester carboxylesterase
MTIESTGVRKVRSVDGTEIAFERHGTGTALILVDAAGHYRAFSSFGGLIGLLAGDFTVYHYDRRGRGESTDRAPYAVEREVDDLAALIKEAGGSAFLYGFSSGACWLRTRPPAAWRSRSWRCWSRRWLPSRIGRRSPRSPPSSASSWPRAAGRPPWSISCPRSVFPGEKM